MSDANITEPVFKLRRIGLLGGLAGLFLGVVGVAVAGYAASTTPSDVSMWSLAATFVTAGLSVVAACAVLRGLDESLLFGVPAVTLSVLSVSGLVLVIGGEASAPTALALFPAWVGSWLASGWVRVLDSSGATQDARVEGTSTVRGLAWAWIWILALLLVATFWDAAAGNTRVSDAVTDDIASGFASLIGIAVVLAYGGRGYTEFVKARNSLNPSLAQ